MGKNEDDDGNAQKLIKNLENCDGRSDSTHPPNAKVRNREDTGDSGKVMKIVKLDVKNSNQSGVQVILREIVENGKLHYIVCWTEHTSMHVLVKPSRHISPYFSAT